MIDASAKGELIKRETRLKVDFNKIIANKNDLRKILLSCQKAFICYYLSINEYK